MSERQQEQRNETDERALRTRVSVLREENERLRREYARAKRTTYRRTAGGLVAVGALAAAAGLLLPDVREVLFVVAAIGAFGGVLTAYLTPERVLAVDVSESVYAALSANGAGVQQELGLQNESVYIPTDTGVRLFVPQHSDFEVPEELSGVFVAEADASRGVALAPSGLGLAREFERARTGPDPESLPAAAEQLGDALVEQFEIADAVAVDADADAERVAVTVEGTAFGPFSEFDHPAVSLLACGAATALDEPVSVDGVDEETVALRTRPTDDS